MIGLDQVAAVYTPGGDGDYTVLAKSDLACRLVASRGGAASPADERADMVTQRFLMWGASYTMPSNAQVVIEGARYGLEDNTLVAVRGLGSQVEYQRVNLVEAL